MALAGRIATPATLVGMLTALLSGCNVDTADIVGSASPSATPATTTTTQSPEPPLVHNGAPLWDVVSAVVARIPLTGDTFGQALGTTMVPGQFSDWEGSSNVQLADDIQLFRSELRLGDNGISIAGFYVRGRCVTVDELKSHYPDIRITEIPRGPNQGPPLTRSTDQPWGRMNFSDDQRTPPCLGSVYFTTGF